MSTLYNLLESKFRQAFNLVGIPDDCMVLLTEATKDEFGDYQVNGVMNAAKKMGKNPRELATQVIAMVNKEDIIASIELAGPGFINITLADMFLAKFVYNLTTENKFGAHVVDYNANTVVIDYSSPNLAKEMHVGHLRSTIIGDALHNVLAYLGNRVIRQNHVGDWGTQFGMLIAYMLEQSNTNAIEELEHTHSDLETFYRKAKIRYDEDQAFQEKARQYVVTLQNWEANGSDGEMVYKYWKSFTDISLSHCQKIYDILRVHLTMNDLAPESMYNNKLDMVIKVLNSKGLLKESDGAKCVFFEGKDELGSDTPFIVQKSDGGYLYSTTDLAAIDYRVHSLKSKRILYVVDARQSLHFKQLFVVAKKSGFADSDTNLEHIQFGTMMSEDGKPFKTRSGEVVKLIDLIEEAIKRSMSLINQKGVVMEDKEKYSLAINIAIASIKYADLSKSRVSDYIFSFDKMLSFDGNTAPYLLYAFTRIQSLLRKSAQELGYGHDQYQTAKIIITKDIEHKLVLTLARFADILELTARECYLHFLCQYLYNLACVFMQFYETCSVVRESNRDFILSRLLLSSKVKSVLQTGLGLLGIDTVDRM